jgi:hypothetical protein
MDRLGWRRWRLVILSVKARREGRSSCANWATLQCTPWALLRHRDLTVRTDKVFIASLHASLPRTADGHRQRSIPWHKNPAQIISCWMPSSALSVDLFAMYDIGRDPIGSNHMLVRLAIDIAGGSGSSAV